MYFDNKNIKELDKLKRINLMNSITGIKPVILVGTKSLKNVTNLAIFSSIVHVSSNPALLAFFVRTNKKIRRDTFENIIESKEFTFNHIHSPIIQRAHFTSIKFEKNISEFNACNFTEYYLNDFKAPFVMESAVKIGLKLQEVVKIDCTESRLIIGEINHLIFNEDFLEDDFTINLEKSNSISVCGLNHYYENKKAMFLPYARLNNPL